MCPASPSPRSKKPPFDARAIGVKIGVDWPSAHFDVADLHKGILVESEHADLVGKNNWEAFAAIAWAHLRECHDYYDRLEPVEKACKAAQANPANKTFVLQIENSYDKSTRPVEVKANSIYGRLAVHRRRQYWDTAYGPPGKDTWGARHWNVTDVVSGVPIKTDLDDLAFAKSLAKHYGSGEGRPLLDAAIDEYVENRKTGGNAYAAANALAGDLQQKFPSLSKPHPMAPPRGQKNPADPATMQDVLATVPGLHPDEQKFVAHLLGYYADRDESFDRADLVKSSAKSFDAPDNAAAKARAEAVMQALEDAGIVYKYGATGLWKVRWVAKSQGQKNPVKLPLRVGELEIRKQGRWYHVIHVPTGKELGKRQSQIERAKLKARYYTSDVRGQKHLREWASGEDVPYVDDDTYWTMWLWERRDAAKDRKRAKAYQILGQRNPAGTKFGPALALESPPTDPPYSTEAEIARRVRKLPHETLARWPQIETALVPWLARRAEAGGDVSQIEMEDFIVDSFGLPVGDPVAAILVRSLIDAEVLYEGAKDKTVVAGPQAGKPPPFTTAEAGIRWALTNVGANPDLAPEILEALNAHGGADDSFAEWLESPVVGPFRGEGFMPESKGFLSDPSSMLYQKFYEANVLLDDLDIYDPNISGKPNTVQVRFLRDKIGKLNPRDKSDKAIIDAMRDTIDKYVKRGGVLPEDLPAPRPPSRPETKTGKSIPNTQRRWYKTRPVQDLIPGDYVFEVGQVPQRALRVSSVEKSKGKSEGYVITADGPGGAVSKRFKPGRLVAIEREGNWEDWLASRENKNPASREVTPQSGMKLLETLYVKERSKVPFDVLMSAINDYRPALQACEDVSQSRSMAKLLAERPADLQWFRETISRLQNHPILQHLTEVRRKNFLAAVQAMKDAFDKAVASANPTDATDPKALPGQANPYEPGSLADVFDKEASAEKTQSSAREERETSALAKDGWPVPAGVDPSYWQHVLSVYEQVYDFLEPPWDKNAREHRRADVKQPDYNVLNEWLQEIAGPSSHTAEYVDLTPQIEALLPQVIAYTGARYLENKGIVLRVIDEGGGAAISISGVGPSETSMLLRRMEHDGLISYDVARHGFARRISV